MTIDDSNASRIREDLLQQRRGLTSVARQELFEQGRLLRGSREQVPPVMFVDAAETNPIFRGLNHSRNLMPEVEAAVRDIIKDPEDAERRYAAMVKKARGNTSDSSDEVS